MAKRNFLIGFGAGLVFAAGFIMVFPPAEKPQTVYTKDQLQAAAKELQLVLIAKDEYEQLQQKKTDVKQSSLAPKPPVEPSKPVQTALTALTVPSPMGESSVKPAVPVSNGPAPVKPAVVLVPITIPYRATATDVEKLLIESGTLSLENELIETLRATDKVNRIRVGTYMIPKGSSEPEIVRIITEPPKK